MIVSKNKTMSTFLESKHTQPIRSPEDLKRYFVSFSKPSAQRLVGIECELLAVNSETGEAMPYSGENGIETVLNTLAYEFGYEKILENEHTIALQKGHNMVTLEPGGQIELSGAPVHSVHEVKNQLDEFFFELKTVSHFLDKITFLAYGIQPFSSTQSIEWVPKERYKIMAEYLGKRGRLAHDMMKRTATNQVSFDYSSEVDAFHKMCLVMRLTSIASAMFANSSFSKGKPSGFATERIHIWQFTDPERSGLMLASLCPNASFDGYLNYLLDLPMMFIVRQKKWIRVSGFTFRKFIAKGFKDTHATLEDFELHLSTAFPEARFKQYLEIRGSDGQRQHLIPAVAAFWKGILYDEQAMQKAASLVKKWGQQDYLKLYRDIAKKGLRAKVRKTSVLDLARELVKISEQGLGNQPQFNGKEEDERIYLAPLKEEVLRRAKTQGEQLVELWQGAFRKNRKALIDYLKI